VRRFIAALDGPIHWPATTVVESRTICFPENGEMNFAFQGGDESPHSISENVGKMSTNETYA
jgi:hypothetical protein